MTSTLAKESKAASKKLDSCSPIPSRPTNPNSRNSEINPMRRSFSGSPFSKPSIISPQRGGGFNPNTPVNSPSGLISFTVSFSFPFLFFHAVNKHLIHLSLGFVKSFLLLNRFLLNFIFYRKITYEVVYGLFAFQENMGK